MGKKKEEKQEKIDEKDQKIAELTDLLKRTQADYINFRNHTEKQKEEARNYLKKDILTQFLPVLDMFDLALKHTNSHEEFVKGVEMIYAQFLGVLEQDNVKAIEQHDTFDPKLHEAVLTEDGEDGKILEVLQKGYRMGDTILRCSRVKVGKEEKND